MASSSPHTAGVVDGVAAGGTIVAAPRQWSPMTSAVLAA